MASCPTDFEDLGKALEKARKVIERDGIPRFFIKCLVELEDFVNTVSCGSGFCVAGASGSSGSISAAGGGGGGGGNGE